MKIILGASGSVFTLMLTALIELIIFTVWYINYYGREVGKVLGHQRFLQYKLRKEIFKEK